MGGGNPGAHENRRMETTEAGEVGKANEQIKKTHARKRGGAHDHTHAHKRAHMLMCADLGLEPRACAATNEGGRGHGWGDAL